MKRLLLLLPKTTYRADFLEAAHRLGVEVIVGSNHRQSLENITSSQNTLTLDFQNIAQSTEKIVAFAQKKTLCAIVAVDDTSVKLAANANKVLSLHHNPIQAVEISQNKHLFRQTIAKCPQILSPKFICVSSVKKPQEIFPLVNFPCVLKPVQMAASQGVIRANNEEEFVNAFGVLKQILAKDSNQQILIEDYIPGEEFALEGLLIKGKVYKLVLFDKPEPLEGPYFEETLYIAPSRLLPETQKQICDTVQLMASFIGLREGPIHAELRLNQKGVWPLEIAARSIGGYCSRILRFGIGICLEELILRHALEVPIDSLLRQKQPVGVMMIPIPKRGTLKKVSGIKKAKKNPVIDDIIISIPIGEEVIPLPQGKRYLGFIFARGDSTTQVEKALHKAHKDLKFLIQ